tara:strand:- start:471 stop:638 length:168 start_codon:yes stop_codon:yes gene_type:complete
VTATPCGRHEDCGDECEVIYLAKLLSDERLGRVKYEAPTSKLTSMAAALRKGGVV